MDYWTPLMLGLVGSLHCAGMCGPLALAVPSGGYSGLRFLASRTVYNLGRLVTYCALGLVFGVVGKALWLAGLQRWVSVGLGIALLVGVFTSRRLAIWTPVIALVQGLKRGMGTLLRRPSMLGLICLGLLNGFLPCGLVYAACLGATSTSGVFAGAQYMAIFGLGTLPMMLTIGLSGKLVPAPVRLKLSRAIPVSVCVLGVLLIVRGMSLGIPFLSPDLAAGGASCCHK